MDSVVDVETVSTVVIGAGQSGLSVGYHLRKQGLSFVILESNDAIGDNWRKRWDSLRLFTPARFDGLAGMPFPAHRFAFPTKDEMADYLAAYAEHFELPVQTGVRVDRVTRFGSKFLVTAGRRRIQADQVVVAMASFQKPRLPAFTSDLSPEIMQLHSSEYRNPSQLRGSDVLVVGAGNSGAEIALELARAGRRVSLAGRDPGRIPYRPESFFGRHIMTPLMLRFVFHRLLTSKTPMGRRIRPRVLSGTGGPVIRVKPSDLAAAGVTRVPRIVGVRDGLPELDGGRVIAAPNVVWCTGYHPGLDWLELPAFGEDGHPVHDRGISLREPGLYFVGLFFLHSLSSTMIHAAARDSAYIARSIARRSRALSMRGTRLVSPAPLTRLR